MDDMEQVIMKLTGQGWELDGRNPWEAALSRPYENRAALWSWDVGVILACLMLMCVAAKLPVGTMGGPLLTLMAIAGIVGSIVLMVLWRYPRMRIYVTRRQYTGDIEVSDPRLTRT